MKTTEAIAARCIDATAVPVVPAWPSIDAERAASQQLAAADEAYIAELERYARRSDALLRGCATQPPKEQP